MREKAVHVLISGRVQEVGYRQACRSYARSLGLVGWVRNLSSGQVEMFAQGDADAVDRLIDWAWTGPSLAAVTGLESDNVALDVTVADFFIQPRPTTP
jgi:acylphosphatase